MLKREYKSSSVQPPHPILLDDTTTMQYRFLGLISLAVLLPFSLGDEPAWDFKFMVNFWGSDQCCGYGFGISVVRPDECVYVGASRPGGEGSSIEISSSPRSDVSYDPMSYGYGIGYNDAACTNKAFEIRTRGCFTAPDLQSTLRSFSFKLDPSMPKERRKIPGGTIVNSSVIVPVVAEVDVVSFAEPQLPCRTAEWFRYFDKDQGRVRRVSVNGSLALIHQVADLYNSGKWGELRAFDEQCVLGLHSFTSTPAHYLSCSCDID